MSATGSAQGGFTLLELVVVLAILVTITAAFPLARDRWSPSHRLQISAEHLMSDLRRIRETARSTGVTTRCRLQDDGSGYSILPEDRAIRFPDGTVASRVQASADESPEIVFFADGSSNGGDIQLKNAARILDVHVTAFSGRIGES